MPTKLLFCQACKGEVIMQQIAIIDDDVYIGNMLEEILSQEGYDVIRAYSGTEALYLLKEKSPDLILLDLMLPGISGEELLPKIEGIPVIVLSAKLGVSDKINLLLSGAVDYMTKPFEPKELLARIVVQLRKVSMHSESQVLVFKDLKMDNTLHEVFVGESNIHLTKTEYAILKLLMENPNQVFTKSVILDKISIDTPDCVESSLKVHISNLRKKLSQVSDMEYIEAVWGIGYKLNS